MNENPPLRLSLRDLCFLSLAQLRLAMAGDVESFECLDRLSERYSAIDWDSPAYLAACQAVLGTESPHPGSIPVASSLRALAQAQSEQLAANAENLSVMEATLQNARLVMEDWLDAYLKQAKRSSDLFNYAMMLADANTAMRIQLELLGKDTSEHAIPSFPPAPKPDVYNTEVRATDVQIIA